MKTGLTITIGLLACLLGCERVDDPSDIPFVERLVVKGDIILSNPVSIPVSIIVERTVPVSEQYSTADTRLTDVTGAIVSDGVSHPIVHESNGRYRSSILAMLPGQNFVMYLDWHGKRVTASTTMPYPANIDTVVTMVDSSTHPWSLFFDCVVTPRQTEVYDVLLSIQLDSNSSASAGFPLARSQDAGNDGKLHFAKQYTLFRDHIDSLFLFVDSYDMPYYDFFASQGNPDFENVPLITYFTGPVRWNVRGDGVGLFVARNYVRKTVRFSR